MCGVPFAENKATRGSTPSSYSAPLKLPALMSDVVGIEATLDAVAASTVRNRQLVEQLEAFGSATMKWFVESKLPCERVHVVLPCSCVVVGEAGRRVSIHNLEVPTTAEAMVPLIPIEVAMPGGVFVVRVGVCQYRLRVDVDGALTLSKTKEISLMFT